MNELEKIIDNLYGFNEDTRREFDIELTKAINILEGVQSEIEDQNYQMDDEQMKDYIGDMRMEELKENADYYIDYLNESEDLLINHINQYNK